MQDIYCIIFVMRKLIVNKKYDGKKLNIFLLDNFDGLNSSTFYKALRKKDIRINNIKVNENCIVHLNDEITVFITDEYLYKNVKIDIVYEDDNILIVNKDIGIEIVNNNPNEKTLSLAINKGNSFPAPCHRLDRNTCGLIIFAKNQISFNIISDKFKKQEIEKHYLCTVYGYPKKAKDILIAYLFKDSKKSLVYISDIPKTGYKEIITSYSLIKKNDDNTSVLDVTLHTGRTHQIRAHLAHIGLHIIGDGKYCPNEINKKFKKKVQELCAYKLIFNFKTDSGILNYLNGKEIKLKNK